MLTVSFPQTRRCTDTRCVCTGRGEPPAVMGAVTRSPQQWYVTAKSLPSLQNRCIQGAKKKRKPNLEHVIINTVVIKLLLKKKKRERKETISNIK